jgi:acetyltransferase-like isoleucine patch superfamily enzyme
MNKIASTARMYPNVQLGRNVQIDDFAIVGMPPRNAQPGELETVIGDNAHIRSHSIIYAGNRIGDDFATGHGVMIRELNEIGCRVSIGTHSVVEHHVHIEDHVRIHSQAFIPEYSTLMAKCWIGPNVVLTNALHPLCPKAKECLKGATIEPGAKIGANATLLPDITVGRNALVGAGSVVVADVPAGVVVVGCPARVVKSIEELTCPYDLIETPYKELP